MARQGDNRNDGSFAWGFNEWASVAFVFIAAGAVFGVSGNWVGWAMVAIGLAMLVGAWARERR